MMKEKSSGFRNARTKCRKFRFLYVLPCFYIFIAILALPLAFLNLIKEENHGSSRNVGRHLLQNVGTTEKNCIPPSIDSFPDDFMTQEQRQKGGIIIHLLIVLYTCAMLSIICDDYFLPSLDIISNRLHLPPDVAGATFMAIGTSTPELFSSIIGSFITEGDIGVGTVVGSAVFNILGVSGLAGLAVWGKSIDVDWYPVTRDTSVYLVTIAALTAIISDNIVTWWESLILLIMFGMYIVLLYFNSAVEKFTRKKMMRLKIKLDSLFSCFRCEETLLLIEDKSAIAEEKIPYVTEVKQSGKSRTSTISDSKDSYSVDINAERKRTLAQREVLVEENENEDQDTQTYSLCSPPSGCCKIFWWILMWPSSFLFYITIPDSRKPNLRKFYVVTFLLSTVWLGAISYVCVWMVTIIGYTMKVPDSVSGLTLLAVGTSLPEMLSSVIIARSGLGNMVLANLIGSNIFDILFCLGAPWFIKTLLTPTGRLIINSSALTYTSTTLLTTVVGLLIVFSTSGWKLNSTIGFVLIALYVVSVTLSCLYEMNVFGYLNPTSC